MKILQVVGARPNFMKVAPVLRAVAKRGFAKQTLVHTGQHYDASMSGVFFADLEMPKPDAFLGAGSGSHAEQTAAVLVAFERVLLADPVDLVVVAGDVNSTLACALVAAKLETPVAHIEAGLRSFDWTMPEEINRVVTDRLSALLFTPSEDGDRNLAREGITGGVHRVGNAMIDSLLEQLPAARRSGALDRLGLRPKSYALLTLHRPHNVDSLPVLSGLLGALARIASHLPVVFPVHPRTRKRLEEFRLEVPAGVRLLDPLGYIEFLGLTDGAALVLTDSGGIQEETTVLGIPCLTLRENTERPVTVEVGTNQLVGLDPDRIVEAAERILKGERRPGKIPDLWDGHTGERIAAVIEDWGKSR